MKGTEIFFMKQPAGTREQDGVESYFARDFNAMHAWRELGQLAHAPYDLTAPGALSPARIQSYRAHAAGFELLYSTQRVDEAVLSALQRLVHEFLNEVEVQGIICLENAEISASVLLSQLHGSWFMRRILKIDRPTAHEISDQVEIAMNIFTSSLSARPNRFARRPDGP